MTIPNWANAYLKEEYVQQIVEAIKRAEKKTSGEIVPMIVRRSSTIGHVPVILLCLLVAVFFVLGGPGWQADLLGDHFSWYLVDIVLLLALTALLGRWTRIQRLCTTRFDQAAQVDQRAQLEFYESNIKQTKDATGVLIFVSLMERRATVLADSSIHDQVPQGTWNDVCDILTQGMKKKNIGVAFSQAIDRCGEILSDKFPIKEDDENELQDRLIIKE